MTDARPPQADADHAALAAGDGVARDQEQAETELSPHDHPEPLGSDSPESFSIDDVLRDAERLMNGEPVPHTPDAAEDLRHATAANHSPAAPQSDAATDDFELDDLQSAIDEAIREAEEKKTPPSVSGETDEAPAAVMSDVEAEVAKAVAEALAEVESTSTDSPTASAEPAPPTPVASFLPPDSTAPASIPSTADAAASSPAAADLLAVHEAEDPAPSTAPHAVELNVPANEAADVDEPDAEPSESDEHFAAVETVLAAEESNAAGLTAAAPEAEEDAADLDAALAAKGKAALDAEDESEPAPAVESTPDTRAGAPVIPPETHPSPRRPAGADAAAATPDVVVPSAEARCPVATLARRVCGTITHAAAARYTRIGDAPRKIVAWSAWGTLVQAAVLWTWILFLRSGEVQLPDPHSDVKSAAHAPGDSHGSSDGHAGHGEPAADKGHGSHGAPAEKGHGSHAPAAEKGHGSHDAASMDNVRGGRETRGSAKKGGSREKDSRGSKKKEEPAAGGHH